QRLRMPQVPHEVDPTDVRLHVGVADIVVVGHIVEFAPSLVQRRDPGVATAREVENSEIKRRTEQVIAQGLGDELVDLVADATRHTAHDGANRFLGCRAAGDKLERIEKRGYETKLMVGT